MSDLDRYVEALFDDDADVPEGMGRVWAPELHRSVMARLRAGSGPRTRTVHEYVSGIHKTPGTYRSGRRTESRNDREVMEATDHWVERWVEGTDSELAVRILGHGVEAATRRYDRGRAAAWYALWRRYKTGRPLRKHRGFHTFMEGGVDDCPDCVRDMDRLAGGEFDRAAAALLDAGGPAADWPEQAVKLVAWVTEQRHPSFRLFAQRAADRVWYIDLFRASVVVFDGRSVAASPVPFTLSPASDVDFVADATRCDQQTVAFSGKHNYRAAQRYGRHVLLMEGTYYTSRGQAEMNYSVWLSPPTAEEAAGLVEDFAASLPRSFRRVPIWSDPRRGSVMRKYSGEFAVGVWGSSWATGLQGARLDREFAGEQEAITALEAQELDWLKAGKVLTNLYLRMPEPKPSQNDTNGSH
ncbi:MULTISPECIES: hypothetical protein [Streptosporangium]|uniref:Uncharacterized protein n=1 Tax=Streptosporangium brasiliense TaxID=47480 RepID=A0ABT9RNE5_9ACTN|nr:hypothetical protein [Streptosporangium brasiliense]MDP9869890.1 hypothetical protein [Streptosporangium brasiliense]